MISASEQAPIILSNSVASLSVDLFGGALTDFHLFDGELNPLTFRFSKGEMPANNKEGAPYQGHFLCLGRWGEPSPGEKRAGLPDHGQFANQMWQVRQANPYYLSMYAESKWEGLKVDREIRLDKGAAVFHTLEAITNINPLGRLYNIVQHPSIARPFLKPSTKVFCNADKGFHYACYKAPGEAMSQWPQGINPDRTLTDLSKSENASSGVYSFIVEQKDEWGWITAYTPEYRLLLGYLWRRSDYPWINVWRDYHDGEIRYRGLEFGTSGIHQHFGEILRTGNTRLFDEPVFEYIDAGQVIQKEYLAFLHQVDEPVRGIKSIHLTGGNIIIDLEGGNKFLRIPIRDDFPFKG